MLKIITLALSLFIVTPLMSKESCPLELKSQNLCAHISWKLGPQYGAYSTAIVKYWKKGAPKEQLTDPEKEIEVYPWMVMKGMEHGGSDIEIKKVGLGTYEVSKILFLKMMGHWELRFKNKGKNPKKDYLAKLRIPLTKKK